MREAPTAPRFVGPALTSAPAAAERRGRRAEAEIDEGSFVNKRNDQPASLPTRFPGVQDPSAIPLWDAAKRSATERTVRTTAELPLPSDASEARR